MKKEKKSKTLIKEIDIEMFNSTVIFVYSDKLDWIDKVRKDFDIPIKKKDISKDWGGCRLVYDNGFVVWVSKHSIGIIAHEAQHLVFSILDRCDIEKTEELMCYMVGYFSKIFNREIHDFKDSKQQNLP